ncbi:MAG: hypothetical protein COT17_06075 [Elusimicrobia bacterium CG08_land_8_20_14_0_20_51_18]|nr:MAG: hypothetical protein COT17_06075 [Elusimicrobia bacterium CG08_land_8_20_14_0_20_51_18]
MQKYIDEFFDILERSRRGALLYVLCLVLLYGADRYLGLDMETFKKLSTPAGLKAFLASNSLKLAAYALLSLALGAYASMGYWGCVMKKGEAEFSDFFANGNRMFFRSLPGYMIEGLLPLLILSGGMFVVVLSRKSPAVSLVFMTFFVFSVWFSFRIIFWELLMYREGLNGLEAVRKSFSVTGGHFSRVFWFLLFPIFVFNVIGGGVSDSFLRYAFLFINILLLPLAVIAVTFMLYAGIFPSTGERSGDKKNPV